MDIASALYSPTSPTAEDVPSLRGRTSQHQRYSPKGASRPPFLPIDEAKSLGALKVTPEEVIDSLRLARAALACLRQPGGGIPSLIEATVATADNYLGCAIAEIRSTFTEYTISNEIT